MESDPILKAISDATVGTDRPVVIIPVGVLVATQSMAGLEGPVAQPAGIFEVDVRSGSILLTGVHKGLHGDESELKRRRRRESTQVPLTPTAHTQRAPAEQRENKRAVRESANHPI